MRIYHANILPMTASNDTPPTPGWIAIEDGKITQIGTEAFTPTPADIDAQGGLLLPGFVDAHTHLGIIEDGLNFEGDDCNEATDPFTPQMRALDAINPMDICFPDARARGITTVLSCPGSANPAGGSIVAIKTAGNWLDAMCIRTVGMKFALGENPKTVYDHRDETPVTRMATAAILREGLWKAKRYRSDCDAAARDNELSVPELDMKCEALLPLLRGEQLAFFHCHRADDLATALRIAKEFSLRPVIIHGTEGHLVATELAAAGVPVIVGPLLCTRCKPELQRQSPQNAARLHAAGVPIAICTDHPEVPIQYLPLSASAAVKGGLPVYAALQALTATAADIAGIGDRVGRLCPGMDADLQLYAPQIDPLALASEPEWVMINGTIVSRKGESV